MKSERGFILNIIMIALILAAVFLSQQSYAKWLGQNAYAQATAQGKLYWTQVHTWFLVNIQHKASGEVSTVESSATQQITQQKNNFLQNIWETIKNYFAKKFSTTFAVPVK